MEILWFLFPIISIGAVLFLPFVALTFFSLFVVKDAKGAKFVKRLVLVLLILFFIALNVSRQKEYPVIFSVLEVLTGIFYYLIFVKIAIKNAINRKSILDKLANKGTESRHNGSDNNSQS